MKSLARNYSMPRLVRWVSGYALRRWPQLVAVQLAMLLQTGLNLLKPVPMALLIDYVLKGKIMPPAVKRLVEALPGAPTPTNLIGWSVAATVLIFLLSWAVGLFTAYTNISFGQRMIYDLAADLFAKLQQLSLRFHTSKSVGDNIRRVTSDCGCVSVIVKDALMPMLAAVVTLVAMFAVMWRISPSLTLLALVVVPWMALVFRFYARPMMDRSYAQHEAEGESYSVLEQTLAALPVVQAFGREEENDRRFRTVANNVLTATLSSTRIDLQFKLLMGAATAVGTAAILWWGARQALAGELSVGLIVLFLAYLGSLYAPIEAIMYASRRSKAPPVARDGCWKFSRRSRT